MKNNNYDGIIKGKVDTENLVNCINSNLFTPDK